MAAWLKTHPDKRAVLERVSFGAEAVWHMVNLYSAAVGNNGVLPAGELHVAVARKITAGKARTLALELVAVGLWRDHGDRFELVDWLKDQPEADVWTDDTKRERWARGKALLRDRNLCRRIQARDLNRCRYCGERVDWTNRRGPLGGTYDHVDPDGDNHIRNVVVACRRCNGRKKDRTPAQAGMVLLTVAELAELAQAAPIEPGLDAGPEAEPVDLDQLDEELVAVLDEAATDLTPIQPELEPRPDSLAHAREAGPNQNGTRTPSPEEPGPNPPSNVTPSPPSSPKPPPDVH